MPSPGRSMDGNGYHRTTRASSTSNFRRTERESRGSTFSRQSLSAVVQDCRFRSLQYSEPLGFEIYILVPLEQVSHCWYIGTCPRPSAMPHGADYTGIRNRHQTIYARVIIPSYVAQDHMCSDQKKEERETRAKTPCY